MTSVTIFIISGLAIVVLTVSKKLEEKRNKPFFIFNLISKGNIHARELYHRLVHLYSKGREKVLFSLKKQTSMHVRNLLNKLLTFLKDKREQYMNNMRDSKLLRKSDGISEFFKNMSDIEKGNGEINDTYENGSQDDKKELD